MTLFSKLAEVDNKLAGVEVKLGLPQRKHFLVRHTTFNQATKKNVHTDTLILPQPFITTVQPRFANLQVNIEGADSIFLSINDLQVEIPRTVPKTLFLPEGKTRASFYVEPPVAPDPSSPKSLIPVYKDAITKTIDGYAYKLIYLQENDPIRWLLILTRDRDGK